MHDLAAFADRFPRNADARRGLPICRAQEAFRLLRLIQITDLHLSDRDDTPAAEALRWAVDEANRLAPDLVAVTGDMTTYGTADSARQVIEAVSRLKVPWAFTPGNAERRSDGAMAVFAEVCRAKSQDCCGVRYLLPDTSCGPELARSERDWLASSGSTGQPTAVLTHLDLGSLDASSRSWAESWVEENGIELWLAGHLHENRSRRIGGCLELVARGLNPDKGTGGPSGMVLLERAVDGSWLHREIPWPQGCEPLSAAGKCGAVIGWSIHGEPADTVRQTRAIGLSALELRPRELDYRVDAVFTELSLLRAERAIYLSWHLPRLRWDVESGLVTGVDEVARQVADARRCCVDALTVHVPEIGAGLMAVGSAAWDCYLRHFDNLFREAVAAGIRLSIENVHNDEGTALEAEHRKFATEIGEYLSWIDAVAATLGGVDRVGAHFDIGHARNNGELGNYQPLGDWYARVGNRITGYHIHQVRHHEETGKLINHRDITSVWGPNISFSGFLHAWSTRLVNRAPLFVEVRIPGERLRTVEVLREIFAETADVGSWEF